MPAYQPSPIALATLAARKRTSDDRISTCVEAGRFSVVLCTPTKRTSSIDYLAKGLSMEQAIAFLNAYALTLSPTASPKTR